MILRLRKNLIVAVRCCQAGTHTQKMWGKPDETVHCLTSDGNSVYNAQASGENSAIQLNIDCFAAPTHRLAEQYGPGE